MLLKNKLWVFLAGFLALSACKKENNQNASGQMNALTVNAVKVSPEDIPLSFEYPARVQGSKEVEVRARVGGILLKRNYIEGTQVNAGDVLFEIDPAQYKVALEKAKAQLLQNQAQLQSSQSNWKRISTLFKQRVVSEKSRDDAKASLDSAMAAVQMAQAQVDEAQLNLDYTLVTAPVSGLTSLETQSEGSLISASGSESLLTNITQTDPVYVLFSAAESEIYSLTNMSEKGLIRVPHKGKDIRAKVKFTNGDTYSQTGDINFINPTVNENTGTIKLRAVFPNPDGGLRPGQFVRLVMEGMIRIDALVVPQEAVMQGSTGSFVYKVNDKGLVEIVNVQTGLSTKNGEWIIDEGLKPGDIVVTSDIMKLRTGMPVKTKLVNEAPAEDAGVDE